MDYRIYYSLRIDGPKKEMDALENKITSSNGMWTIKLAEHTCANVYCSQTVGQAYLEFHGSSGFYIDDVIEQMIEHMAENKSHDITCKYRCGFRLAGVLDRKKHVQFEYNAATKATPLEFKQAN